MPNWRCVCHRLTSLARLAAQDFNQRVFAQPPCSSVRRRLLGLLNNTDLLQDSDHVATHLRKFGMTDIANRVQALVAAHFGIEQARVTPQASLVADLGANSLDLVEITMGLEQEFDLPISDAAAEEFQTIGDMAAFIQGNCGAK